MISYTKLYLQTKKLHKFILEKYTYTIIYKKYNIKKDCTIGIKTREETKERIFSGNEIERTFEMLNKLFKDKNICCFPC